MSKVIGPAAAREYVDLVTAEMVKRHYPVEATNKSGFRPDFIPTDRIGPWDEKWYEENLARVLVGAWFTKSALIELIQVIRSLSASPPAIGEPVATALKWFARSSGFCFGGSGEAFSDDALVDLCGDGLLNKEGGSDRYMITEKGRAMLAAAPQAPATDAVEALKVAASLELLKENLALINMDDMEELDDAITFLRSRAIQSKGEA